VEPIAAPVTVALVHEDLMSGVAAWRAVYPIYELATRGHTVAWAQIGTEKAAQYTFWAELVVLLRPEWGVGNERFALQYIDQLHSEGRCVVYDTDDDVYSETSKARIRATGAEEFKNKTDTELETDRQHRIFCLRLCDAVTVSTEHLASVVRQLTDKPVRVLPNVMDLKRFQAALGPKSSEAPLTIGWAGGNRTDADAHNLAVAWSRVADRYNVRFLVGGYPLEPLIRAVPADRLIQVPKLPLSIYPQTYGAIDIGCAPLNDELFNRSKSPIKAMEYAAAGAAVCASPIVYGDLIEDGTDGILCQTADEWESAISFLVEHPDSRKSMAKQLLDKVERERNLATRVEQWPTVWWDIVAHFRRQSLAAVAVGGNSA
jgi:glycosyltransferase involved in cell wall biosynthesis